MAIHNIKLAGLAILKKRNVLKLRIMNYLIIYKMVGLRKELLNGILI